jgi:hypothetical protein
MSLNFHSFTMLQKFNLSIFLNDGHFVNVSDILAFNWRIVEG